MCLKSNKILNHIFFAFVALIKYHCLENFLSSNNNAILVNYFLALFIQPLFFFCYVQTKYQIITESPDLQLPFHLIGLAIKALLPNNSSEKEKETFPCSRLFGHYFGWIESLRLDERKYNFVAAPPKVSSKYSIKTFVRIYAFTYVFMHKVWNWS